MQILCILLVSFQVFGGIGTNVFLAFVNQKLQETSFFALVISFLLVGISMFMIPVVPGVAVYLFGGVLIPSGYVRENGTKDDFSDHNFWVGFLIVVGLNVLLKLTAVTLQQKGVGEPMSTNTWILRFVGVNKPSMRAIEYILKVPGMTLPKVMILVGGPDWPTSVLTGILRLPLFQMLLGTLPVFFNVAIVSAAGAFRLREKESSTWKSFSSLMLTVAVCINVLLMVSAAYSIQETWEKFHGVLEKPRREHLELDWLDHVSAEQQLLVAHRTKWTTLPKPMQILMGVTTCVFVASSFTMTMLEAYCWEDFQVTDKPDGLKFMKPLGAVGIIAFFVSCGGYIAFGWWASMATRTLREEVRRKLLPEKEAWLAEREKLVDDSLNQDVRLVVVRIQKEVARLRRRVQELEALPVGGVAAELYTAMDDLLDPAPSVHSGESV